MKKINWQIVIPIIVAIIVVAVFVYLDYQKQAEQSGDEEDILLNRPIPISPSENPRRGEQLSPSLGCAGPPVIEPEIIQKADSDWLIDKNGKATTVSLGKYRINVPKDLVLDVTKLWLYFFSNKLSDREDGLYGLEKSYTSKIVLIVNDHERELNLGGDKYMFIELDDYPLGDLYPYDKKSALDFEFLIELKYDSKESLDYLDGADIRSQIRIFATGCQDFTKDLEINAEFKYGD